MRKLRHGTVPSRQKLTGVQNSNFRALSPQHSRCPGAPFSKPAPASGLQTNARIHICCVAANTQAAASLQLPSAALVQRYSSVTKIRCTNFALTVGAGMCRNVAVSTVTMLRAWTVRSSSPGMDNRFIFSPNFSDRLCSPNSLHCAATGRAHSTRLRQPRREDEQSPPPIACRWLVEFLSYVRV